MWNFELLVLIVVRSRSKRQRQRPDPAKRVVYTASTAVRAGSVGWSACVAHRLRLISEAAGAGEEPREAQQGVQRENYLA